MLIKKGVYLVKNNIELYTSKKYTVKIPEYFNTTSLRSLVYTSFHLEVSS